MYDWSIFCLERENNLNVWRSLLLFIGLYVRVLVYLNYFYFGLFEVVIKLVFFFIFEDLCKILFEIYVMFDLENRDDE